ncbi:MAG: hypothetical protein U0163_20685 [Gemmatimonadaceae bacterium]
MEDLALERVDERLLDLLLPVPPEKGAEIGIGREQGRPPAVRRSLSSRRPAM